MAAVAAFSTRRSNLIEEADASADFLLLEKLGEGSFGKVYRAQQHSIKRHVAIKVVPVAQDTGEVAREIETLKECDSDNIVRCGPHRRPDTLFLGTEHRCSHLVLPCPQVLRLLPARPRAMDCHGVLRGLFALRYHGGAPARVSMGAPPHPSPAPLPRRVLQGFRPAPAHTTARRRRRPPAAASPRSRSARLWRGRWRASSTSTGSTRSIATSRRGRNAERTRRLGGAAARHPGRLRLALQARACAAHSRRAAELGRIPMGGLRCGREARPPRRCLALCGFHHAGGQPAPLRERHHQAGRLRRGGADGVDHVAPRHRHRHALLDGARGHLGRPRGRLQRKGE